MSIYTETSSAYACYFCGVCDHKALFIYGLIANFAISRKINFVHMGTDC